MALLPSSPATLSTSAIAFCRMMAMRGSPSCSGSSSRNSSISTRCSSLAERPCTRGAHARRYATAARAALARCPRAPPELLESL
eukprot:6202502-Pleurochrysis_carterae.AAC.1